MAVASTIAIKLDAQTAELKKGFTEGRQAIDKLSAGLSGKVASGMAKFHVALLAVKGALSAVQGAINSVLNAMVQIDQTEKFAARIGLASDQLRVLNFAAEQSGASVSTMQMALQRMTRRISEAANGTGEAVGALDELGLSAQALEALSPDQAFAAIADAMQNVSGQSDKVRLAMKLFDSEGVALVNTLAGGSEALNAFGAEAESMGILLGDQGSAVEAANSAINRMRKAWGGLIQQVAIAVAPALETIANILTKIVAGFNKLFSSAAGTGGGAFDKLGTAAVDLGKKMEPVRRKVEDFGGKVVSAAEKAQAIVDKMRAERQELASMDEQAVGAVTRSTAAGFSAVQQAHRDRRNAERQRAEQLAELRAIRKALMREGLHMVEVDL